MVHRTGRIFGFDPFCYPQGIELAPSFVKEGPQADAGSVIEQPDHAEGIFLKLVPALFGGSGQQFVVVILQMGADDGKDCRHIGYQQLIQRASAVHHILPDDHAQTVAVIIPSGRLDFQVLPDCIKGELLHLGNIEDHRFVRRRCHEAFRPVALIQNAVEEIGAAVESKARLACRRHACSERAHGKIRGNLVIPRLNLQRIQKRVFRAPEAQFLYRKRDAQILFRMEGIGSSFQDDLHLKAGKRRIGRRRLPEAV